MTAAEIRQAPILRDEGPYSSDAEPAIAFFLREIAAQLAELKELTTEVRELRVGINAITELFDDVVDRGAGQYPGRIRTEAQS